MTTTESQDIILYVPKSNILTVVLMGGFCLLFGIIIPFLAGGRQLPALLVSLFFIIAGIWFVVLARMMFRRPVLSINAEGISSEDPFSRKQIQWDEIDSIYCIHTKNGALFKKKNVAVFAVDLSPFGLVSFFARQNRHILQGIDITEPQLALGLPDTNLSLPAVQVLSLVRERFSAQLERYNIDLDDGSEADKEPGDYPDSDPYKFIR